MPLIWLHFCFLCDQVCLRAPNKMMTFWMCWMVDLIRISHGTPSCSSWLFCFYWIYNGCVSFLLLKDNEDLARVVCVCAGACLGSARLAAAQESTCLCARHSCEARCGARTACVCCCRGSAWLAAAQGWLCYLFVWRCLVNPKVFCWNSRWLSYRVTAVKP